MWLGLGTKSQLCRTQQLQFTTGALRYCRWWYSQFFSTEFVQQFIRCEFIAIQQFAGEFFIEQRNQW